MALSWGARRQFLYYAVATVLFVVFVLILSSVLAKEPTCFDGKQNGGEAGVDCGGACSLVCRGAAAMPNILWARAFQTGAQTYTVAAYVDNKNPNAVARNVPYSFKLLDTSGLLVAEVEGRVTLPPGQRIPVVETNIDVGNRSVSRALFAFLSEPVWERVGPGEVPLIKVVRQDLAEDGSRLSAELANESLSRAPALAVVAVLFDQDGTARAASESRIEGVAEKSVEPIVFTWPGGVPNIVRAEITVIPSL